GSRATAAASSTAPTAACGEVRGAEGCRNVARDRETQARRLTLPDGQGRLRTFAASARARLLAEPPAGAQARSRDGDPAAREPMRRILLAVLAIGLVLPATAAPSSSTWRVVKSKTVSGQFAATGISATIRRPRGIAVRFLGSGVHGTASWGCS